MEGKVLRSARDNRAIIVLWLAVVAASGTDSGRAVGATRLITFDEILAFDDPGVVLPADHYASQGVLIASGKIAPDLFAVGDDLSFSDKRDQFAVSRNLPGAVSPRNCFLPAPYFDSTNGGYFDMLLTFTTPVTHVEANSDIYPGDPPANYFGPHGDPIRLAALAPTALANEFSVLAYDQKYDDAIGPPDDLLAVDFGGRPFSYALIEVIDEREEFDNLRFTQVSEPSTAALLAIGCVAILIVRRR